MVATVIREAPSFDNVRAGGKAVTKLSVNKAYAGVYLEIRHDDGTAGSLMTQSDQESYIANVLVRAGSPDFGVEKLWDLSGAHLIALNNFYGIPAQAGVLPLVFGAPYWNNPGIEDRMRLGTKDLDSLEVEVTFAPGVTSPEMVAYTEDTMGANFNLGQFVKLQTNNIQAGSTGEKEVSDLPVVGTGIGLKALHIATADIDDVEVEANGDTVYEDKASLRPVIADNRSFRTGGRSFQAGYTHIDLAGNDPDRVQDTTAWRDFRVTLDMQATGGFDVVSETVIGRFG